jgi:phospholipid/cholesterol/gamma-HCH transport system substrate-binding protein
MKFKIRFADQIVGIFIIFALLSLVFVIFMLGSRQRWFVKDYEYKTIFETALGITENMAVQYKGFTIGSVKTIRLNDNDEVEVVFSVYREYGNRVREGSLVELEASPIGLGNHFYFYPGRGNTLVEEGGYVPAVNSSQGQNLVQQGLSNIARRSDSIGSIISRVDVLLQDINGAIAGSEITTLGRTLGSVESTVSNIQSLSEDLGDSLSPILADIRRITANMETMSAKLADPEGAVSAVLDVDGEVYRNLTAALASVSGTLRNIERTTDYLPGQMPQIVGLISELHTALRSAEDVLTAILNNPLFKRGVPDRVRTSPDGLSPRGVQF